MRSIDDVEARLVMLGDTIVKKNDFGIIYRHNYGSMQCIKLTKTRNGIITTKEDNVSYVSVTKHFITIFDNKIEDLERIFVKTNPNNIIKHIGGVYYVVSCNLKGEMKYGWTIPWESPIILIVSMKNRLYMINYSGKMIDITPEVNITEPMLAGITFDSKNHRFYIGYRHGRGYGSNMKIAPKILDNIILKTDRDFKDIQYFNLDGRL